MPARSVITGAFNLLEVLRVRPNARISELQRTSGMPRSTVTRLLSQLEQARAVERQGARWRLGPALVGLGSAIPADPRLPWLARRSLLQLSRATREEVGLTVEIAGRSVVADLIPGQRRMPVTLELGIALEESECLGKELDLDRLASSRAHVRAHADDLRPVIDAGTAHKALSCAAVALRVTDHDVGSVWITVPGPNGVPNAMVDALRVATSQISRELALPSS